MVKVMSSLRIKKYHEYLYTGQKLESLVSSGAQKTIKENRPLVRGGM